MDPYLPALSRSIYAIGDCIQGPMLAHKAEDEGLGRRGCMCGVGVCMWGCTCGVWGCICVGCTCMWRCTLMCGGVYVGVYRCVHMYSQYKVSINVVNNVL